MYEEYPSEEESRLINYGDGDTEQLDGDDLRIEVNNLNNNLIEIDEEGPFNTVAYYNFVGNLLHGIEFVELPNFPRRASLDNFYERGQMIHNLAYSSHEINEMRADFTINRELAEELSSVNEAVAALIQNVMAYIGDDEDEQITERSEFRKLAEAITIRDIQSLRGKNEIYDYWQNYYDKFQAIMGLSLPVVLTPSQAKDFESAFERIKIPCIVLQHTDAEFEQASGRFGLLQMANEILFNRLGMVPSKEYAEVFGSSFEFTQRIQRDDFGQETGRVGEMEVSEKENADNIEMVKNSLDPLTYLNLLEKKILFLPQDSETTTELKNKINQYLPEELSGLNPRAIGYLSDVVSEAVDDYVSLVDKRDRYYLPMLDSHTSEMSSVPITKGFTIAYYTVQLKNTSNETENIRDEPITIDPNIREMLYGETPAEEIENPTHTISLKLEQNPIGGTYSALMDYLNEEIIKMFSAINSVMVEGKKTKFVSNIGERTGKPMTGSGQSAAIGAKYPSIAGSLATLSTNNFAPLLDFIYSQYISDIDYRYLFNRDYPEYFRSGVFVSFKSAYDASRKKKGTAISQQVAKFPTTAIDEEDLKQLERLVTLLRRGATSTITSLIEAAENTVQIFLMLNLSVGQSRADRTKIQREITNSLGRVIFEYASRRNEERLSNNVFAGKQIQEYAGMEVNARYLNIIDELESADFMETLSPDERSIVGRVKQKLTGNFWREILGDEDSDIENSLLKAVDIMRGNNGLFVYKAFMDMSNVEEVSIVSDLIRKEDRVDLYAQDMETILKSPNKTFAELSVQLGVSREVIYKIRGLFR